MTALLKLTVLCLFATAVLAASSNPPNQSEKDVQVADLGDDFPSDESLRDEDQDDEEDRLHIKKKPSGLHGFLVNLIKPKPHKKPKNDDIVTKTTMIHVTKRVKTHPVCMTVHGAKPNCIEKSHPKSIDEGLYIIENTATPKLSDFSAVDDSEDDLITLSRSARYLSFAEPTPEMLEVKSAINEDEIESEQEDMGRFIFHKPSKKVTVTKTLYVTKVQKITDYGITATLAVANCVPSDIDIPYCPKIVEHTPKPSIWREDDTKEMLEVNDETVDEIVE